jgi:hypothetical protein
LHRDLYALFQFAMLHAAQFLDPREV